MIYESNNKKNDNSNDNNSIRYCNLIFKNGCDS